MDFDGLENYLDSLDRETVYRVDEVLKESSQERTERVYLKAANGVESGPLIRKFIKQDSGIGRAYQSIFDAQRSGRRFKCLPRIMECYTRDEDTAVVMEYVAGETLAEHVYRRDPSIELAREVFPALCDAVIELHERFDPPIIHRDLKPSNVIVCGRDREQLEDRSSGETEPKSESGNVPCDVVLIDFGIAREFREGVDSDTTHFGTRAFAPPEQFGFGQTTPRSDVYALGMILYYCLTEEIPTSQVRERGFADSRIPEALRELIVQATAFDPAFRFASARALKNAFLAVCEEPEEVMVAEPDASDANSPHQTRATAFPSPAAEVSDAVGGGVLPAALHHGVQKPPVIDAALDSKPYELIGRIWNVIVGMATAGLCAFAVNYVVNPPAGQAYSWPIVIFTLVITIPYFLLVGFACLDKRRLRRRFSWLDRIKTWQIWIAVVLVYFVVIALGRLSGLS